MSSDKNESLNILDEIEKVQLKLLIKGMNTSEIAKYLSISYHETAEVNRAIKKKLKISSIEELKKIIV